MTSLLLSEQFHNDHINPYTFTRTFGVSYNGGYKAGAPAIAVETEVNDDVMFPPLDTQDSGVPADHFNPLTLDDAGNMYLKTGSSHPATSFLYPARKVQYDDGTTNFTREVILGNAKNYVTPDDFPRLSDNHIVVLVSLLLLFIILLNFFKLR